MLKVALTGGIATGKSHVLDLLRARGVPCLDADTLAHGVMAPGTEATSAIAGRFGADILAADGSVDRAKLGPVVFADAAARRALETIVHPAVYRAIAAGLRAFELISQPPLAVVDVPLLFETGAEKKFDRVIVTTCPAEMQVARLRHRGLAEPDARARLAAQWPTEKKVAGANYVVRTDGSFADTEQQVSAILAALISSRP
jgi:dephospho-CoA kinase